LATTALATTARSAAATLATVTLLLHSREKCPHLFTTVVGGTSVAPPGLHLGEEVSDLFSAVAASTTTSAATSLGRGGAGPDQNTGGHQKEWGDSTRGNAMKYPRNRTSTHQKSPIFSSLNTAKRC